MGMYEIDHYENEKAFDRLDKEGYKLENINPKDFGKFVIEIEKRVKELNLKEDCINKAFDHKLFNKDNFNANLDNMIKFVLDGLKALGMKKPATSFLDYVREEAKGNETLGNFINNPKSGSLMIEIFQRLRDTMLLLERYKNGEKKLGEELKRRKVL